MKKDISQPSERARVSAASVDLATRFNLVDEFQAIGATCVVEFVTKGKLRNLLGFHHCRDY